MMPRNPSFFDLPSNEDMYKEVDVICIIPKQYGRNAALGRLAILAILGGPSQATTLWPILSKSRMELRPVSFKSCRMDVWRKGKEALTRLKVATTTYLQHFAGHGSGNG